ncbi:MAG TPA: C40 family peptidase [Nocardioidaceae bacterium]|jgi:cell wall-associated NlpC family hydrolase
MFKAILAILIAFSLILTVSQTANAETIKHRAYVVARAQLGDPYEYGAEGPDAFDCSGLMWFSYKHAGHPIRRTTHDQYYRSSFAIAASDRHRGDLVFFLSSGSIRHVGTYAGSGYMIHANSGHYYGRKVIRERIAGYWSEHYGVRYRSVKGATATASGAAPLRRRG